jgi:hypothetical protein
MERKRSLKVAGATGLSGAGDALQGCRTLEAPAETVAVPVLALDGDRQLRWPLRQG